MTRHHPDDIARIRQLAEELDNPDGAVELTMTVWTLTPEDFTPSPEFPPGHPRSAWPTVELADGPDLASAIDEVYSTACHECGAAVDHLCMTRETADILPENTPHIARVLATTIIDSAWQEPTAHPALRARWDAENGPVDMNSIRCTTCGWVLGHHPGVSHPA